MGKISAVYKIVNTITGEFYIGSSVDVKQRWIGHKCPAEWERRPNSRLYKDFQKYGLDCFSFQILVQVEPEYLREEEQKLIDLMKPTYNNIRVKGHDTKRYKDYRRNYQRSYRQSDEHRINHRECSKNYNNLLCLYNGETLKLSALAARFRTANIQHPYIEAKKYLL